MDNEDQLKNYIKALSVRSDISNEQFMQIQQNAIDLNQNAQIRRRLFDQKQQDSLNARNFKDDESDLKSGISSYKNNPQSNEIEQDEQDDENDNNDQNVSQQDQQDENDEDIEEDKQQQSNNIQIQQNEKQQDNNNPQLNNIKFTNEVIINAPKQQPIQTPSNRKKADSKSFDSQIKNIKMQGLQQIKKLQNISLFRRANMVKRVVNYLMERNPIKNFQKLDFLHFNIINDQSYFFQSKQEDKNTLQSSDNNIINQLQIFKVKLPVFLPNQYGIIISDIIFLAFTFLHLFALPIKISFQFTLTDDFIYWIFYPITTAVFIIQIFINLNTGFYQDGQIVIDRYSVIKNYIPIPIIIDFVSMLSLIVLDEFIYVQLIFFIRVFQLKKMYSKIDEFFQIGQKFPTITELTKLLFLIFTLAHYSGCVFHYIGSIQQQNSWLQFYQLEDQEWTRRYLRSLYYSIITMITIGYGDTVPITDMEIIYVIIMSLFACGVFGYAVNTIGNIFKEMAQREADYQKKKYEILRYMDARNISKDIQLKVVKYLEFVNSQEKEKHFHQEGEQILNQMSRHLKEDVLKDFYGKILKQSKLFNLNFSKKFLDRLSLQLKEITLGPGEILYNQGDYDNKLYYLNRGTLEVIINQELQNVQSIDKIQPGKFIGYSGFFCNIQRETTIKSIGFSHIISFVQEDFQQLIKHYPLDYEKFCMIRDEYHILQKPIDSYCNSCQKHTHDILNCHLLQYQPNIDFVIQKYNHSVPQERSVYERKERKKYNALNDKDVIQKNLRQKRLSLILYAYEDWNEVANFLEDEKMDDKEFFLQIPALRVFDDVIEVMSDDSFFSDDDLMQLEAIQEADQEQSESNSSNFFQIQSRDFDAKKQSLINMQSQQLQENMESLKDSLGIQLENSPQIREQSHSMQKQLSRKQSREGSLSSNKTNKTNKSNKSNKTNKTNKSYKSQRSKNKKSSQASQFSIQAQNEATGSQQNILGPKQQSFKSFSKQFSKQLSKRDDNNQNRQIIKKDDGKEQLERREEQKKRFSRKISIKKKTQQQNTIIIQNQQENNQNININNNNNEERENYHTESTIQVNIQNEFDQLKEYVNYFPKNNLSYILKYQKKKIINQKINPKKIMQALSYKSKNTGLTGRKSVQKQEQKNKNKNRNETWQGIEKKITVVTGRTVHTNQK